MKKTVTHEIRLTTATTTLNVSTLAPSRRRRWGVAPKVSLITPVAYSEVMTSTPRTPMHSWATLSPA